MVSSFLSHGTYCWWGMRAQETGAASDVIPLPHAQILDRGRLGGERVILAPAPTPEESHKKLLFCFVSFRFVSFYLFTYLFSACLFVYLFSVFYYFLFFCLFIYFLFVCLFIYLFIFCLFICLFICFCFCLFVYLFVYLFSVCLFVCLLGSFHQRFPRKP